MYCYPEEIYDELIQTMKEEKKICHYLDLPIQHASDRILKRMGRRTSQADLRAIIGKLRQEIPARLVPPAGGLDHSGIEVPLPLRPEQSQLIS